MDAGSGRGKGVFQSFQGAPDAALFLHGITTYSFLWKDVVSLLKDHLTFFAPDLMGCGDSSKPAGANYSLSAQADMILGFIGATVAA